jgi:glycosyltransferase involved in cell wall biosynthesis
VKRSGNESIEERAPHCEVLPPERLRVVMLSYHVTEEAGGPAVAAAGFAAGLARLGADVTLIALGNRRGRWLVDEARAATAGYRLVRLEEGALPSRVVRMVRAVATVPADHSRHTVLWVNGIWGAQSLAGALVAARTGWPYVVRPAGSLGHAALRYRPWKKLPYYYGVEGPILRRAASLHCMSDAEVRELPAELVPQAFIVPSGVDVAEATEMAKPAGRPVLGVLARIHPIKNHHFALDAVEALHAAGVDVELEMAGSVSDQAHEARLRARVAGSAVLRERVRFLGHVARERVPEVVGRWRVALLLSEQENFGHAVIAAAAAGVPTVASPGVGVASGLEAAGAGFVVAPADAAIAVRRLLREEPEAQARACRAFARQFAWETCSQRLFAQLAATAVQPRPR